MYLCHLLALVLLRPAASRVKTLGGRASLPARRRHAATASASSEELQRRGAFQQSCEKSAQGVRTMSHLILQQAGALLCPGDGRKIDVFPQSLSVCAYV